MLQLADRPLAPIFYRLAIEFHTRLPKSTLPFNNTIYDPDGIDVYIHHIINNIMFSILEAAAVPQPEIFSSYEDLFAKLDKTTRKQGYKIVKARSQRSRLGGADVPDNQIVRCDLVCSRGGRPYKSVAKTHKTTTRKTNCPWRAKAVYRKNLEGWTLTIHCDEHNHEPELSEGHSPSSPTYAGEPMTISDNDMSPPSALQIGTCASIANDQTSGASEFC